MCCKNEFIMLSMLVAGMVSLLLMLALCCIIIRCDTSYMGVGTRCKLFQTCDRAVLVGGGWNRQHSGTQSLLNIFKLDDMLQRNGFQTDNIKIFYANGGQPVGTNVESGEGRQMLSSVMKIGLRGHLRTICESRHCADTLFIYLNNPTTVEGDILLWDVDADGMVRNNFNLLQLVMFQAIFNVPGLT